jgi:hypothetical protein
MPASLADGGAAARAAQATANVTDADRARGAQFDCFVYFSGNTTFQSLFMSTTVHPLVFAWSLSK